jgi:HNH endonuclease/AP2 domain
MMLTQERLKELLHYDPETGVFTWIATKARRVSNGDVAGGICRLKRSSGLSYRLINIDRMPRGAHRLAWLYVYGYIPRQIDHIDGDGLNNRISNLRPCSNTQNRANTGRTIANHSGFKGVSWSKNAKRWRSTINSGCRQIHLGYFDSPESAHAAYRAKAYAVHGQFARFE